MYILAPRFVLLELESIKTLSVRLLPAKARAARSMASRNVTRVEERWRTSGSVMSPTNKSYDTYDHHPMTLQKKDLSVGNVVINRHAFLKYCKCSCQQACLCINSTFYQWTFASNKSPEQPVHISIRNGVSNRHAFLPIEISFWNVTSRRIDLKCRYQQIFLSIYRHFVLTNHQSLSRYV